MWPLLRDLLAQTLATVALGSPPTDTGAQPGAMVDPSAEAPLEFRCDTMQVQNRPNRALCQKNVVIRRGDLLVCCQFFEGQADDNWGWQRFICTKDVRARRNEETMWAEKAEFVLATSELFLTGRPRLLRGQSLIEGLRVIVDVKHDRARVEKPTGVLQAADSTRAATPAPSPPAGPLPESCPLPRATAR